MIENKNVFPSHKPAPTEINTCEVQFSKLCKQTVAHMLALPKLLSTTASRVIQTTIACTSVLSPLLCYLPPYPSTNSNLAGEAGPLRDRLDVSAALSTDHTRNKVITRKYNKRTNQNLATLRMLLRCRPTSPTNCAKHLDPLSSSDLSSHHPLCSGSFFNNHQTRLSLCPFRCLAELNDFDLLAINYHVPKSQFAPALTLHTDYYYLPPLLSLSWILPFYDTGELR